MPIQHTPIQIHESAVDTFRPAVVRTDCPFIVGQPDVIWAAYIVAAAILGVGLMMAVGFLYLVFSPSPEALGGHSSVGGLNLWGRLS